MSSCLVFSGCIGIPSYAKCQFYKTGLHLFDHCLSGYFETNFSQSFRFSMYEKKNLPQSEHFLWISKYLISLPFGPCVQCQQITSLFLCLQNNFLIKFIADLLNLKFYIGIIIIAKKSIPNIIKKSSKSSGFILLSPKPQILQLFQHSQESLRWFPYLVPIKL